MLVLLTALALSACQKEPVTPYQDKSGALVKTPQESVATPAADLPASEASVPPAPAIVTTPNAGTLPASPGTMTKEQENTAMPMAGQANDHSAPSKK